MFFPASAVYDDFIQVSHCKCRCSIEQLVNQTKPKGMVPNWYFTQGETKVGLFLACLRHRHLPITLCEVQSSDITRLFNIIGHVLDLGYEIRVGLGDEVEFLVIYAVDVHCLFGVPRPPGPPTDISKE